MTLNDFQDRLWIIIDWESFTAIIEMQSINQQMNKKASKSGETF